MRKNQNAHNFRDRLIAIGDIHGCVHTLQSLLEKIEYNKETDTLVFIGDYIDRGNFSCETVKFLIQLQQEAGKDKVICLRGNHEQMLIHAVERGGEYIWKLNGGGATLESYERNGISIDFHIDWFKSLPLAYDTPFIIFCHAGLSFPKIADNRIDDLLWGRDWISQDKEPREKQVIFGHTPSISGLMYTTDTSDICIDTGCVFGGNLCALIINPNGSATCTYEPKNGADDIKTDEEPASL